MLVMRKVQLEVLGESARRRFEERLGAHLRRFFPRPCEVLGQEGLRQVCREGIERAQSYGMTSERDLCKFLSLVFVFGRDFDREQPWAAEILRLGSVPSRRMERLYAAALARADEGRGILSS